jgi:hypothetical protein
MRACGPRFPILVADLFPSRVPYYPDRRTCSGRTGGATRLRARGPSAAPGRVIVSWTPCGRAGGDGHLRCRERGGRAPGGGREPRRAKRGGRERGRGSVAGRIARSTERTTAVFADGGCHSFLGAPWAAFTLPLRLAPRPAVASGARLRSAQANGLDLDPSIQA